MQQCFVKYQKISQDLFCILAEGVNPTHMCNKVPLTEWHAHLCVFLLNLLETESLHWKIFQNS